jgi:hypothetical protein
MCGRLRGLHPIYLPRVGHQEAHVDYVFVMYPTGFVQNYIQQGIMDLDLSIVFEAGIAPSRVGRWPPDCDTPFWLGCGAVLESG